MLKIFYYVKLFTSQRDHRKAKDAKRVVVVGGGYIGIELVEAFVESGKQVTLVDGLDRILNKYLDKPFTDVLEKELVDRGVNLALGENVQQFVADEQGKVAKVITPSQEFEADMVIMCVGFRPNTELLKDKVDMLPNGAIEVNEYMQTSNPDILLRVIVQLFTTTQVKQKLYPISNECCSSRYASRS